MGQQGLGLVLGLRGESGIEPTWGCFDGGSRECGLDLGADGSSMAMVPAISWFWFTAW